MGKDLSKAKKIITSNPVSAPKDIPNMGLRVHPFVFFILAVCAIYYSVALFGKTLIPSLYYPPEFIPLGQQGYATVNTFQIDLGTPAFYEFPVNKLVGSLYFQGVIPLWNPFQGCGTPLLAQYSTRVLFPYQIAEDLSPWWLWDYFMLGRLIIAGYFSFLFLRLAGISRSASLIGGMFYMFSGSFVWFINCEQFVNVAMTIPILIYSVERLHQNRTGVEIAILALAFCAVLVAGQPEIALYAYLLGFAYFVFREGWKLGGYPLFAASAILGIGLSLPVILPFLEFVHNCFTPHPFLPKEALHMGNVSPTPVSYGISLIAPTSHLIPTIWRITPSNGVWDWLGGYMAVSSIYFMIGGFFSRNAKKGLLLFFSIFGIGILLKNFNVPLFNILGQLPLFNQSWSPRWAGCVWTFSLAMAGAIGFEMLLRIPTKRAYIGGFCITTAVLLFLFSRSNILSAWGSLPIEIKNYCYGASFGGIIAAIIILSMLLFFFLRYQNSKNLVTGIVALLIIELWFYIPKGLNDVDSILLFLPVGILCFSSWLFVAERKRLALFFAVLGVLCILGLETCASSGLPVRRDPFSQKPFIKYVEEHVGNQRILSTEKILFPNISGAFEISDIKFINSISVAWYQRFIELYLMDEKYYAGWDAARLWFTGIPMQGERPSLYQDITDRMRLYSFLGVKYLITPNDIRLDLPMVYENEVRIYENKELMPRAFIVNNVIYSKDWEDALEKIRHIDLQKQVILEEETAIEAATDTGAISRVYIEKYSPSEIKINAETEGDGVLVISDVYYPGWRAKVDGIETRIMRANGFVRGIPLKKGKHIVVMEYKPFPFLIGSALALVSLVLIAMLFFYFRKRK